MTEVERLERARDTWKASAECWEALANKHRETVAELQRELRWAKASSLFWYDAAVSAESPVALEFKDNYD